MIVATYNYKYNFSMRVNLRSGVSFLERAKGKGRKEKITFPHLNIREEGYDHRLHASD